MNKFVSLAISFVIVMMLVTGSLSLVGATEFQAEENVFVSEQYNVYEDYSENVLQKKNDSDIALRAGPRLSGKYIVTPYGGYKSDGSDKRVCTENNQIVVVSLANVEYYLPNGVYDQLYRGGTPYASLRFTLSDYYKGQDTLTWMANSY